MTVWADLHGQPEAVKQLRSAASQSSPAHAWLITGPPGSGRSNAAKAFAAALNCEQRELSQRGCGHCHACRTILVGSHPDVTVVETDKTTISIEEARELVSTAQDRPAISRWRVIFVADADRMTERTTNVLLKAIEEPPPQTVWLLCAPSPADVLVTIRSRCRMLSLRIPSVQSVAELLIRRDGIDPARAEACARAAQSHVGVARRLATDEQARNRRAEIVRLPWHLHSVPAAVRAASTLVDAANAEAEATNTERNAREKAELLATLGAAESGTLPPAIRAQVRRLDEDQKRRSRRSVTDSLDRALTDLLSVYRDALRLQLADRDIADEDLINAGLRGDLAELGHRLPSEKVLRRIEAITATRRKLLGSNVAPLLAVEAMMSALV